MEAPELPWRQKKRPAKQQLSRELVVRTALRVLGTEGIDAVSMRRVAQELETGAASLYAHVANKDDLHELMFDEVLSQIPLPEADAANWDTQLKELLRGQVRAMLANPGIAKVAWATQVPVGPHALRHGEATLALLRAGGLDEEQAAFASDALSLYTKAFAYEGSAWASGENSFEEAQERGRQVAEYLRSAPGVFPNLAGLGQYFSAETASARFEFALDVFLGGLKVLHQPR